MFGFAVAGKAASAAGNLDAKHSYTYIEDVGKALVILGERDEALGKAWHVPNANALTTRQFINLIFEELGQPAKMSAMGKTDDADRRAVYPGRTRDGRDDVRI